MSYVNSRWALKVGDLVKINDSDSHLVGVVLSVRDPGIVRVRWGAEEHSYYYSSNDLVKVKVK